MWSLVISLMPKKTQAILARLALQAEGFDGFLLRDGIIRKNGRIWLGANLPQQTRITNALHASATDGHSGFPVTYRRIKQLFAGSAILPCVPAGKT
jgi:hypothetical protein